MLFTPKNNSFSAVDWDNRQNNQRQMLAWFDWTLQLTHSPGSCHRLKSDANRQETASVWDEEPERHVAGKAYDRHRRSTLGIVSGTFASLILRENYCWLAIQSRWGACSCCKCCGMNRKNAALRHQVNRARRERSEKCANLSNRKFSIEILIFTLTIRWISVFPFLLFCAAHFSAKCLEP